MERCVTRAGVGLPRVILGMKPAVDVTLRIRATLLALVAISAGCAFVSPASAFIIGGIAGVLVVYGVFFWDKRGVDDPAGAISVHGINGAFGVLAVGLFANGDYGAGTNGGPRAVVGILPFGSVSHAEFLTARGWGQLGAQATEVAACLVTGFGISYLLFRISDLIVPMRVSREVELQGLDIPEMGALAYPDFEIKTLQSIASVGSLSRIKT